MVVRFMPSAASFMSCLPTRVDPVNETFLITGEASKCVETCDGTPNTIDITPLGSPASMSARATSSADAGVCSAGFMMQGHPAARAAPSLRHGLPTGKFHGANAATGPTGSRSTVIRTPGARLRQHAAISPAAFFGVPFQNVGRAVRLQTRFVNGLAFFDGGDAGDMLGALVHQIRGALQNLAAILRRHAAPHRISLFGGVQRAIQIGFGGVGQHADAFAGGRIHHRFVFPAVSSGRPFAANEKFQIRILLWDIYRLLIIWYKL